MGRGRILSTHGYGICEGHTSDQPNYKLPGHMDSGTHKHPKVPGKDKNKGWDEWMLWRCGLADYIINYSCAVAANYYLLQFTSCSPTTTPPNISPLGTTISDTDTSGFYLTPRAPCTNINSEDVQIFLEPMADSHIGPLHPVTYFCHLLLSVLST